MENEKTYGNVHEMQRVVTSRREAAEVVSEIIESSELTSEHIAYAVLSYIDKCVRDDKKIHATLSVIEELTHPFPDEIKIKLFVEGTETTISAFLDEKTEASWWSKWK